MTITGAQKDLIEHVVNVFETGSPQGDYGDVEIYCDGHDGSPQITYGRSQTTEQGNLRDLVKRYAALGGVHASEFILYINKIGTVPLAGDRNFVLLLTEAGSDPIMHQAEDEFFDFDYFTPAMDWATKFGFTQALSALVIYDSFIHSGAILGFLRSRFLERPPVSGGDEKIWIKEYVFVRGEWLRTYFDPSSPEKTALLHKTVYRTGDLMRQIVAQNWDLSQLPIMANGVEVAS